MTEHEFETKRGQLWHTVLKNELLILLLPKDVEWNRFFKEAQQALQSGGPYSWPALDPRSDSVVRAASRWLGDASSRKSGRSALSEFLAEFDQVEYLRPRADASPSRTQVAAWADDCSMELQRIITSALPADGQKFWTAAVRLARYVQDIESGTPTFWHHFDQVL